MPPSSGGCWNLLALECEPLLVWLDPVSQPKTPVRPPSMIPRCLHRPTLLLATLTLGLFGARAAEVLPADTLFVNGPILTIHPRGEASALAVRGGRILAVGSEKVVRGFQGTNTEVVDLKGSTLMPGFVEPHVHIDLTAVNLTMVQVGSEKPGGMSVVEVKEALAEALPKIPAGGWLLANSFDPSRTTPLFAQLTADDLDAISKEVPIFVLNASGHIAYLNHKAIELSGITDKTPDPPSGRYGRDAQGRLTGQLFEPSSFVPFFAKMPPPKPTDLRAAFLKTLQGFSARGVTTAGDLNTGLALGVETEIAILRSLAAESPVRVRCYLAYLALLGKMPPVRPLEGDDKVRFLGIKVTADGSTQGYTAALGVPYLGSTNNGALDWPATQELIGKLRPYYDAGWQIATHANGDRAIDQTLEVYGNLLANTPDKASRRLRIEHFTVTTPAQLERVRDLGVSVSMTIGHVYFWGSVFQRAVLGADRAARIDPAGDLKRLGVRFSFHSDSTVTSVDPLRYLMNAVTRVPQQNGGKVLGPRQRISIDDALQAMTLDAAYQMFMEDRVGSLEVGKYADLVVLDRNPRRVNPAELDSLKIQRVYLGGVRQR